MKTVAGVFALGAFIFVAIAIGISTLPVAAKFALLGVLMFIFAMIIGNEE